MTFAPSPLQICSNPPQAARTPCLEPLGNVLPELRAPLPPLERGFRDTGRHSFVNQRAFERGHDHFVVIVAGQPHPRVSDHFEKSQKNHIIYAEGAATEICATCGLKHQRMSALKTEFVSYE